MKPLTLPLHLQLFDPAEETRGHHLTLEVSEADAVALVQGEVRRDLRRDLLRLLKWEWELRGRTLERLGTPKRRVQLRDEERAARPVRTKA